jgi:beta-lactamase class A
LPLTPLSLLAGVFLLVGRPDLTALEATFGRIAAAARAQVGVALVHVESGTVLSIHGDERFPMASVYKLPIALELLAQVNEGRLTLDRQVALGSADIRPCCNISRHHPHGGISPTARELLELMLVESDNTAADAVLKLVGGPAVVERRLRALGFADINVNRYDGDINLEMSGVASPPPKAEWTLELQRGLVDAVRPEDLRAARARYTSDPRDTATPNDMARFLGRLYLGDLLPRASTDLMFDLMTRATTGPARLKGRLPPGSVVAHKTGTTNVVINDVGIITLPEDSAVPGHLVLAVFVMNGARVAAMQQTIAQLAGAAFEFFTGKPLPAREKAKRRPSGKRRGPR